MLRYRESVAYLVATCHYIDWNVSCSTILILIT
jgi:hypothetical protein